MTLASYSILAPGFVSSRATFSLRRVWTVAHAMLQARQTRRLLAEMDDRLLADIGTTRADTNRPFWDIR
jgi:uncharacterized protein YjiS (DUF1127 family)